MGMTREQMDALINQHFSYEATDPRQYRVVLDQPRKLVQKAEVGLE